MKILLVGAFSGGSIVKDLIVCLKIERTAAGAGLLGLGCIGWVGWRSVGGLHCGQLLDKGLSDKSPHRQRVVVRSTIGTGETIY